MAAALDCPSELTQVTSLNNGALTLYTAVVVSPTSDSESILCARLESDSESWVGFGISPTGLMLGANTIIGVPAYGDFVSKFNSTGDPTKQAPFAPMDDTHQTLMNTKLTQVDGKTVVSFSKYLNEEGENKILADGENTFLWAVGTGNEPGYHAARGEFTLEFAPVPDAATTTEATSMHSKSSKAFLGKSTKGGSESKTEKESPMPKAQKTPINPMAKVTKESDHHNDEKKSADEVVDSKSGKALSDLDAKAEKASKATKASGKASKKASKVEKKASSNVSKSGKGNTMKNALVIKSSKVGK
eukprot:CAMPEP_0201922926 /NCGR_PEP_ID=MMETSP0903-20130614/10815_1 /ASSEMBLY_ACC=CAM_ASM_000552 /TAXON_ID=420261 /ORGANISM="Thalassiosira antarctica, Strain CCMP982" /LENGTH=301 /DNA_ID=CAMNT_0048460141 /DNA_START=175 /DNA_END=1080 /DNA_ORIENTATION=-